MSKCRKAPVTIIITPYITKAMNTNIQIFESAQFGTIRTMVDTNGEPMFVGMDVALALGYLDQQKAIKMHVEPEDKLTRQIVVSGQRRNVTLINESGLYSLILSSKLESAKSFKRWVTSEVLPQIRKTGGYIPTKDSRTGKPLSETEIIHTAENIMQKTISMENRPADGCLSASEVAKALDMEVRDLNMMLVSAGVIFWNGSRYRIAAPHADKGLAQDRNFHYYALDGTKKQRPYLVWTAEGVEFIKQLLLK